MYPVFRLSTSGAVEACFFESPKKTARRERGFHLGSFFPSCMVESRTYTGLPHTWRSLHLWVGHLVPEKMSRGARPFFLVREMIMNVHSIVNSHRPKGSISSVTPADGSMQHHSSRHRHNGLNVPLCNTIMMMGTYSSKVTNLFESCQFCNIFLISKSLSIV